MPLPLKNKSQVIRKYKRFVLNGIGGVGKSTGIATIAKRPLVFDLDGRFPSHLVEKADFIEVPPNYLDFVKLLHQILNETTLPNDWIQFDTATKIMSIVEDWTIAKDCAGSKEKYNAYGHGLKFAPQYFKEILDVVDAIQAKHGVNVAFVCHSKVRNFQNPLTEAYTKNVLDLPDIVADKLKQWADYVGYAYFDVEVDKEKKKAIGDPVRLISFTESPLYEAKNSSNFKLPKGLKFDKDGKWAQVVFGETQSYITELEGLLTKFPPEFQPTLKAHMEEANVFAMGVEEIKSFIDAGKQQLQKVKHA